MWKTALTATVALGVAVHGANALADDKDKTRKAPTRGQIDQHARSTKNVDRATVDKILADWPAKPKSVAYEMIKKYGAPHVAGSEMLVWHDNGPWKRTTVYREEVPHHFPKVHTDLLEQVIETKVPADKLDDLAMFDGAISYHGTTGELAARCDMEAANFLALNLAHDVVTGKLTAKQARAQYGKNIVALLTSEQPPKYVQGLAFEPTKAAGQPDKVTLPGAPLPAAAGDSAGSISDREVLAALMNADIAEIMMATFVMHNTKNANVKTYAQMLKQDHARGLQKAMQLAKTSKIKPVAGGPVPEMKEMAAENMAKLAQQDDAAFERTYMSIAIAGHQHKLDMIDNKLLPATKNPQLKSAVAEAREMIEKHLEMAKQLDRKDRISTR